MLQNQTRQQHNKIYIQHHRSSWTIAQPKIEASTRVASTDEGWFCRGLAGSATRTREAHAEKASRENSKHEKKQKIWTTGTQLRVCHRGKTDSIGGKF